MDLLLLPKVTPEQAKANVLESIKQEKAALVSMRQAGKAVMQITTGHLNPAETISLQKAIDSTLLIAAKMEILLDSSPSSIARMMPPTPSFSQSTVSDGANNSSIPTSPTVFGQKRQDISSQFITRIGSRKVQIQIMLPMSHGRGGTTLPLKPYSYSSKYISSFKH